MTSEADIARRAQELKALYLSLSTLVFPALFHPSLPLLQFSCQSTQSPGDFPLQLEGPDGERVTYSARQVAQVSSELRGAVLTEDLVTLSMQLGAIRIGEMIKDGHLRDDVPLLQFSYHFRNAVAHGDRWHFLRNQPSFPASCRELEITTNLEGKRATMTTVHHRLYIEFLDDLTAHFGGEQLVVAIPTSPDNWVGRQR